MATYASFIGVHYNIPASTTSIRAKAATPTTTQGKEQLRNTRYNGRDAAREGHGKTSVHFWILALDSELNCQQA